MSERKFETAKEDFERSLSINKDYDFANMGLASAKKKMVGGGAAEAMVADADIRKNKPGALLGWFRGDKKVPSIYDGKDDEIAELSEDAAAVTAAEAKVIAKAKKSTPAVVTVAEPAFVEARPGDRAVKKDWGALAALAGTATVEEQATEKPALADISGYVPKPRLQPKTVSVLADVIGTVSEVASMGSETATDEQYPMVASGKVDKATVDAKADTAFDGVVIKPVVALDKEPSWVKDLFKAAEDSLRRDGAKPNSEAIASTALPDILSENSEGVTTKELDKENSLYIDRNGKASLPQSKRQVSSRQPGQDLSEWNNFGICANALQTSRKDWDRSEERRPYIKEANSRSLGIEKCRELLSLADVSTTGTKIAAGSDAHKPTSALTLANSDISKWDSSKICAIALDSERLNWDSRLVMQPYLKVLQVRSVNIEQCKSLLGLKLVQPVALTTAPTERRVALVMGNNKYSNFPDYMELKKAVNDARLMRDTLRDKLGFEVVYGEDVDFDRMKSLTDQFVGQINKGDIAFIFYSGHGVSDKGATFMLPGDVPRAKLGEENRVVGNSIDATALTSQLVEKGARIVVAVLDACRDDIFTVTGGKTIAGSPGLRFMDGAEGVFMMYSAATGQAALDRLSDDDPNPNSLYTRTLVPLLIEKNLTLEQIAKRVKFDVARLAESVGEKQRPAYYNDITDEIVLNK